MQNDDDNNNNNNDNNKKRNVSDIDDNDNSNISHKKVKFKHLLNEKYPQKLSRTAAQKKYLFYPSQVKKCHFELVLESNGSKKYLIKESHLRAMFCKKHNVNDDQIEEKIQEITERKEKRAIEREKERQLEIQREEARREELMPEEHKKRRIELTEALHKYDLSLRCDSSLCRQYIEGRLTSHWSLEKVVERMCQMKYLYDYCDMDKAFIKADRYKEDCLNEYGCFDEKLMDVAEVYAMRGKSYPDKWPWIEMKARMKNFNDFQVWMKFIEKCSNLPHLPKSILKLVGFYTIYDDDDMSDYNDDDNSDDDDDK